MTMFIGLDVQVEQAKGRAFTFVTKEDSAYSKYRKTTGSEISIFGKADVRVELANISK